jgi:hypothetical protein
MISKRDWRILLATYDHIPISWGIDPENSSDEFRLSLREIKQLRESTNKEGLQLRGRSHRSSPILLPPRASHFIYRHLPRPQLHSDSLSGGKQDMHGDLTLGSSFLGKSVRGKRGEAERASPTSGFKACAGEFRGRAIRRCYAVWCCYVGRREVLVFWMRQLDCGMVVLAYGWSLSCAETSAF